MTRTFAPFAALALAACALAGAGVADPRDHRGEARQEAPRGRPSEARDDPRGGYYGRPADERFGARPSYAPQPYGQPYGMRPGAGAPVARGPNSLGADWRQQQEEARFGVNQGRLAPLSRVIEGIARRTPGRQLDSGIEYMGDRAVYRVRWMTHDGRRIDYLVDAATGAIMGEH